MKQIADLLKTPIGKFATDLVTGGVSFAAVAVLALNLDMTTPLGVFAAAEAGFIGGVLAVARRKLVDIATPA